MPNAKVSNTLRTAALIIGKSGVGKSSLLNYMFGEQLEKTGSGKPVTGMGLFRHEYKHKDELIIDIYDSWGLEPGKAEQWYKLIKDEVAAHDKKGIAEWFNTMIFCFSAVSRVEEFECEIIKFLLSGSNNVVIALTNSKTPSLEENLEKVEYLERETGISRDRIINICSVEKTLLSGEKTKQFGKDALFGAIVDNLWASICGKLPSVLKGEVSQNIEQERGRYLDAVKKNISLRTAFIDRVKFFNKFSGSETMENFGETVSQGIEDFGRKANSIISKKLVEANDYYLDLYNCYNNKISIEERREIRVNIKCDFLAAYQSELKGIVTFNDLKNVKGELKRALFEINLDEVPDAVREIAARIKFNLKSVREKRQIAINTINQCFDDLKAEFDRAIDEKIGKINDLYLLSLK